MIINLNVCNNMNYILKLKLQCIQVPYMAVRIGSHTISTKQFKMDLYIIFKDYKMEIINLIFFIKLYNRSRQPLLTVTWKVWVRLKKICGSYNAHTLVQNLQKMSLTYRKRSSLQTCNPQWWLVCNHEICIITWQPPPIPSRGYPLPSTWGYAG